MITEEQYKRFGIYDQIVDLVADRMKLKSVFETPSALARMRNDPRVLELLQRMVRRLDRLEDSVSAIQEMLPPQDEGQDDNRDGEIADESQEPLISVPRTSDSDTSEMNISEKPPCMDTEERLKAETLQKSDTTVTMDAETFKFKCPHCSQELEAGVDWQGKLLECPSCHKNFPIPPAFSFVKLQNVPADADITQNQNSPESPNGEKTTVEEWGKAKFVYQCTGCGKICDAAAKFCSECGSKVEPKQEPVCQTDESDVPAFQKTSSERFDIIVDDINAECKISVMNVVREITNMGLADAKAFVENLPSMLVANIPKEKAEEQKHRLEEAGADVYLEPSESPDVQNENEAARNVGDKKDSKTSSNAGCSLALLLGTGLFISIWAFLGFWYALIISVVGSFILFMILDDAFSKTASTWKAQMKHPVMVAFILGGAAFYIAKVNIGTWQAFVCAVGIMIVWGLTYDDIFARGGTDNGEKKDERGEDEAKNGGPDTDERDEKNAEYDADEQCAADTDSAAECDDNAGHEFTCPHCGRKKFVPESFVGLHTRCECGRTFSTAETPEEQPSGDLHSEDVDDGMPKIKLTAQAKIGEEWLKRNLCNGEDPAVFLLNRYRSHIPVMTQDEMEKFALSIDINNVKAYLECHQEWVISVAEYKQQNGENIQGIEDLA